MSRLDNTDGPLMHIRYRPGRKNSSQAYPIKANDLLQHANAVVSVAGDLSLIIHPELAKKLAQELSSRDKPPQP
jgi:hypothetical protein